MAYSAVRGRRPMERASKITHTDIIKNPVVREFLESCEPPKPPPLPSVKERVVPIPPAKGHLAAVVAVDGGMTETFIREDFPSASLVFMTFGPVMINLSDLAEIDALRFIGPDDMARLKQLRRYVAVIPSKLVPVQGTPTFSAGVRHSIHKALNQLGGGASKSLGMAPLSRVASSR